MKTTIQLSDDLRQRLKLLAVQRNANYESLIEELMDVYETIVEFKSEREFAEWFEQNFSLFGFKEIISKNKKTPDYLIRDFGGKVKKVELELCAQDFVTHKHKKEDVDMIVALFSKDEKSIEGIPTLVLNTFNARPQRNRVTFVCDEKLWVELRKRAIDEGKTYSRLMEELITMGLNSTHRRIKK